MYQIFLAETSTDDDWERDFDVELTEEELKAADEIAKKLNLSAADYTNIAGDMVSFRIIQQHFFSGAVEGYCPKVERCMVVGGVRLHLPLSDSLCM